MVAHRELLRAGIEREFRAALESSVEMGAGFVPDGLPGRSVRALLDEVGHGPFGAVEPEVGPVRQEVESLEIRPDDLARYPAVRALRDELVAAVRRGGAGIRGLATWMPGEIDVQRYPAGSIGITPHLDGKRFRRLVAVVTLAGTAPFSIHPTRDGPAVRTFDTGPGSILVMRGPGLAGHRDGRPFHSIGGPADGPRISMGFRMRVERPGGA